MAVINLKDASVTINSVDLSDRCEQISLSYESDSVEITAMGQTSHVFTAGLFNVSVDLTLFQDFASAETEATIFPLVGSTTTLVIKPTSGSVSATNPSYTIANGFVQSHQPVSGSVGDMARTSMSVLGGTLTKATS